jgi:DNA/RNA endonuclease YhcR with UshA esterase domain
MRIVWGLIVRKDETMVINNHEQPVFEPGNEVTVTGRDM